MPEEAKPDYAGTKDVERYFDHDQVTFSSTTVAKKIITLRGGEAVVIKALIGNSGNIYIGKKDVTSSNGHELSPGEPFKVEYLPDKLAGEYIDLYGIPATANDKVSYMLVP